MPHRLLRRKRDHGFRPCVPVKSRYKSTCAWKQVLLWNRQVSLPFNRSLAFSRFSLFLLYTVHRCTVQEFFSFQGRFFQNVGNRRFLLVKSPKLPFGLSFGRCRPGLTGIFRRYPLFSERSCQKKPGNVTFLGFFGGISRKTGDSGGKCRSDPGGSGRRRDRSGVLAI